MAESLAEAYANNRPSGETAGVIFNVSSGGTRIRLFPLPNSSHTISWLLRRQVVYTTERRSGDQFGVVVVLNMGSDVTRLGPNPS